MEKTSNGKGIAPREIFVDSGKGEKWMWASGKEKNITRKPVDVIRQTTHANANASLQLFTQKLIAS